MEIGANSINRGVILYLEVGDFTNRYSFSAFFGCMGGVVWKFFCFQEFDLIYFFFLNKIYKYTFKECELKILHILKN